jgi:hypothetical protein
MWAPTTAPMTFFRERFRRVFPAVSVCDDSIPISKNINESEIKKLESSSVTSADLLLHPVRLRIVRAFLGDRALTTTELRTELTDVPAASLYRHVARLVAGGVLAVVAERRIRGALERTYVLRTQTASIGLDELATMTPDLHRSAFLVYMAGLIGDFDRYLDRGDIDLLRDGVSYRMAGFWLTDAEATELVHALMTAIEPRLANAPGPGRKRRIFGTILLPGDTEPAPRDGA